MTKRRNGSSGESIPCFFPFQMIITIQQLVHLCGNDIHHELTDTKVDESSREIFLEFQKGWLDKNMEIAFYEYAKSVKITGDAAIVFYMNEGKVFTKNLSYFDGDTLYPHYDSITGQMTLFAGDTATMTKRERNSFLGWKCGIIKKNVPLPAG